MNYLLSGFLNINKPEGCTSYHIVDRIKKNCGLQKAGHAGTLDPFATGVLIILLNRATSSFNDFLEMEKEYRAEILLGRETDTLDITGKTVLETAIPSFTESKIKKILKSFTGKIMQVPPRFSAKHHKGERFYKLARKNIEFEIEPQEVEVKQIDLVSYDKSGLIINTVVKRGVYIRSLARDIGKALGSAGILKALIRTRVGDFTVEEALPFDNIAPGFDIVSCRSFKRFI